MTRTPGPALLTPLKGFLPTSQRQAFQGARLFDKLPGVTPGRCPGNTENCMPNLIIGSRGSKLALWQSNQIKAALEQLHPELTIEIEIIRTTGDRLTEVSLAQIGGKGVFTKEIEEALLARRIDLAVHSLKDLPTTLPDGLHIAAITEREDVRDALLVHRSLAERVHHLKELPQGARVGTGSPRRAAQLRHLRADLHLSDLRGNVETRLGKLDDGEYDAIILATAGLVRLGYSDRITERIPIEVLLPAVGQGALGIETRIDDDRTNHLLESLNHWPTRHATQGERALLRAFGGGCSVPVAAYGQLESGVGSEADETSFSLTALVIDLDGRERISDTLVGPPFLSEEIGEQLAEKLLAAGAGRILEKIKPKSGPQQAVAEATASFAPAPPSRRPSTEAVRPADLALSAPGFEPLVEREVEADNVLPELGHQFSGSSASRADEPEIWPDLNFTTDHRAPSSVSALPLAGRRLIVTRAAKQAGELSRLLNSNGAEVISCPTIEIRDPSSWASLDYAIKRLDQAHWLAFTSTNGVEYFLRRFDELGKDRAELSSLKVCAVGRKTAEKLMDEGLTIDLMPMRFTADSLVEAFINRYGSDQELQGARLLLPASRTTRDVIRPALSQVGVTVDVVEAYQTVLPEKSDDLISMFTSAPADYIIFTSPSTVANLATLLDTDHLAKWFAQTRVACIGPVTSESARLHGLEAHVQPEEHTARGLVNALIADSQRQ